MRGISGSGKSTKAKELGADGVVLGSDDFWGEDYNFDRSKIGEAHEWNQNRVREALSNGISPVVVDNTNTQFWEMKPYVGMAQQYGYQIKIVSVEVKNTAQELAQRNKHGVPADAIQKMLDKYDPKVTVMDILRSKPPENKAIE